MGTGTGKKHDGYPTYQPIGTGGTVGTIQNSMTESSKPVYKPTVTYAQTSRATVEPGSSSSPGQMYSKTHSGHSSKPTHTGDCKTPGGLPGLSKTQQILLSDTRADAINNVLTKNEDFKFNFENKRTGGPGKGGEVVPANRKTFPALTGTGLGMAVVFLGPCGFNTPHVHPRAAELGIVTEGTVVSSMVPENGVHNADGTTPREILNTLHQYDATIFFQGAVHSQFNPGCGNATFVAALSAEDFGTGQVAQELFGARNNAAVADVFGDAIEGADVDKLRGAISKNVALGVEQCLKRCNINKRK
ncbi:cupin [Apiospora hydei]|uniref:Cupin n=1 Tax=Apiospora hydei TaxID=1337664 RepID=A0ABR1WBJ3_9PEZI